MTVFSEYIIVVFLGLVLGSFATALIYRVPRRISWYGSARSACPNCKTPLTFKDLVPVFSWLAARGRCRACGNAISTLYPLTELLVVLACLGVYWSWGLNPHGLLLMACIPFLVALLVIDLQSMILPDQLVLATALLGLVHTLLGHDLWSGLAGGIGYGVLAWGLTLLMNRVLGKEAMGFGDVKFFAAAGIWLGLPQLGAFCVLGGTLGVGLALAWKTLKKSDIFPFGPALIMSLYLLLTLERSFLP